MYLLEQSSILMNRFDLSVFSQGHLFKVNVTKVLTSEFFILKLYMCVYSMYIFTS